MARPRPSRSSGFLRCGGCGTKLSSGGDFYRCVTSHGGCGNVSIKGLPLERWLLVECLRRWLEVGDRSPAAAEQPVADTAPLLAELHQLEEREKEIGAALADGSLSVRAAGEAVRLIRERRGELTKVLGRSIPAPTVEPLIRSLVEVFTPEELESVGLGRFITARTFDSAEAFRSRWEARDPEAVSQARVLYGEVLDHVVVSRRARRGKSFDPSRVRITWAR